MLENTEQHSPGSKRRNTLKLGALKMDNNETSKKVVNKLQDALKAQNPDQKLDVNMSFKSRRDSTKFEDPSELRSATLRKKNLSSVQGVDEAENMALEVNLNPKDGVTCYKLAAGQDVTNMSEGTVKFQVSKKGKPYMKMSKDNRTRRMTKGNYEELTENASLR